MKEVDEWLVFKIQQQRKPFMLPKQYTDEMQESFKESFRCDHNMIVEEFGFYQ